MLSLVSIWGFGWRVGTVHTETTYKQFSTAVISADVGLKVGLYSFNVTLKGIGENSYLKMYSNSTCIFSAHTVFIVASDSE